MYDPNSPIIDFYPLNFKLALNGKKQDWEAIVKIRLISNTKTEVISSFITYEEHSW
jgi:5'-3' exoribonuclease 1